jgi:5-methylcytosine-specific restriction endonuclease McrA
MNAFMRHQRMWGFYLCRQAAIPSDKKDSRQKHFTKLVQLRGLRCARCGDFSHFQTMDHIKSRCDGGDNDINNLQILCKRCHELKDNLPSLHIHVLDTFIAGLGQN